jgi:hypothetical protein
VIARYRGKPLLLLTTVLIVASCARQSTPQSVPTATATATPGPGTNATLIGPQPGMQLLAPPPVLSLAPPTDNGVDASAPDQAVMEPAPLWVEADRSTSLWSGSDDHAIALTDLPQWTYLQLVGAQDDGRLLVKYAGDFASRQAGIGWVDISSVGPAGDPGEWVTNHRAASLWSGVDRQAVKFTDLPQWTKLRIVDGAAPDATRMEVEFLGDGLSRQPGVGWISRAAVGPITPPAPLPSTLAAHSHQVQHATFSSHAEFIDAVGAAAEGSQKASGVPASVTVAQAILESDWGRSRLSREGDNLFGIKALKAPGPNGVVTLDTVENTPEGDVVVEAAFRAYFTLQQSIDDHGKFFTSNHRYADAMAVASDPRAFAYAIQDAGYATDPDYADKLITLMDTYDLYRFDP